MLKKQTHSTLNFYSSETWHIQYLCRAGNEWQSPWSSFRPCGAVLRRSAAPLRDGADGGESDAGRSPRARGQAETSARRRGRRGVPGDACSTGAQHGRPDQTCSRHRLQEGRTTALCDAFTIGHLSANSSTTTNNAILLSYEEMFHELDITLPKW